MNRFFGNIAWSALGAAFLAVFTVIFNAIFKAVFTVEVEEYWNSTVQPYLVANGWSWVATVLRFLPTFWGGVVATLIGLLIVERIRSKLRMRGPNEKPFEVAAMVAGASPMSEKALANLTGLVTHIATVRAFQFTKEADDAEGRLDWAKQQIMPFIALFGGSEVEELLRWIRKPEEYVIEIQRYAQKGRREALVEVCDAALRGVQDVMATLRSTGELRIPLKQPGTAIETRR